MDEDWLGSQTPWKAKHTSTSILLPRTVSPCMRAKHLRQGCASPSLRRSVGFTWLGGRPQRWPVPWRRWTPCCWACAESGPSAASRLCALRGESLDCVLLCDRQSRNRPTLALSLLEGSDTSGKCSLQTSSRPRSQAGSQYPAPVERTASSCAQLALAPLTPNDKAGRPATSTPLKRVPPGAANSKRIRQKPSPWEYPREAVR